ncbi:BTAD domain-containing putative transcriptional regulator [Agromyces sp. ZXT2-6]|uniref:BTAD domain-containing putative transcriptional regulator n=1 Tax=Agromyces sp. ZXT2-6 TaxID=3461153 RepID=UPI00405511A3
MERRTRPGPGGPHAPAAERARIPWPAGASTVFVIGATGGGKSTLARRWAAAAGGRVLHASAEWSTADRARRHLSAAVRGHPPLIVVDDAHRLVGTDAEVALESIASSPPVERLLVVSRIPPTFELRADALVTVSELVLELTDIVAMFRDRGDRRIDFEAAAHVAQETAGWPELVRRLAVARGPADESFPLALEQELEGDFAAAWLEESLHPLPDRLVAALTRAAALPGIDLARATRLLGPAEGAALIAALDSGVVMNVRGAAGRRALPPMLRRHLLDGMPQPDRRTAAADAARILRDAGDPAGAADALAAGACWSDLARLLDAEPEASRGASRWIGGVPEHVIRRGPAIALAAERGRREDRESVHLATAAAPVRRRTPDAARDAFATAVRHLVRGDAVGSVPWFRRSLLAPTSHRIELLARLALAVIRAPLAPGASTAEALAAVERDARSDGLAGIARVARGAIATTCPDQDRSSARGVIEQLESRGDVDGALLVAALELLARVRSGDSDPESALAVARRADRLAFAELGAWARAAAALAGAASATPASAGLASAARASAIATGLPGPRAVLEAAAALESPSPDRERRLAGAQRLALGTGLPRIPLPRVALGDGRRPTLTLTERGPRLEVACFGGFRMRLDGSEADLHGIRPQARAVLRMLALNAGAPLHRDLIASLLWGELATDSAVHALHVSVSSLRRMLPAEADGGGIVERVGEAYRLGIADRRDCDLASFDDRLAEAAEAKLHGDAARARDGLVGALDLYVGDVLPEDGPAEWAVGARDRYRLRAAEAANSLAHVHARLGDLRPAVAAARRAVEIDPWIDESWRTLIAMHRRAGDAIAGRRAEDGYRSMRHALGVD